MQGPPQELSNFEETASVSYQLLHIIRMQSTMMFHTPTFCFDRCLDTEELYTLFRATKAPIKHQMQEDLKEKECVRNCSAKFDELVAMSIRNANEREIGLLQEKVMEKMFEAMTTQQQQQ